jgi:uncharacterized protein YndB with AHSA1/START domain
VDDPTLAIARRLAADRATVFAACRDAERLAQWWGPAGFSIPALEWAPRAGASYRIAMQPPAGDLFHLAGTFVAVDPPARLAFTFVWEPPDPDDVETTAELTLREHGDGTELALVQGAFKTGARLELHHAGWTESLDRLERLLAQE